MSRRLLWRCGLAGVASSSPPFRGGEHNFLACSSPVPLINPHLDQSTDQGGFQNLNLPSRSLLGSHWSDLIPPSSSSMPPCCELSEPPALPPLARVQSLSFSAVRGPRHYLIPLVVLRTCPWPRIRIPRPMTGSPGAPSTGAARLACVVDVLNILFIMFAWLIGVVLKSGLLACDTMAR